MKTAKLLLLVVPLAFLGGVSGALLTDSLRQQAPPETQTFFGNALPAPARVNMSASTAAIGVDFRDAARAATPSVVFIKGTTAGQASMQDWFWFFGNPGPQTSFGSGVIISADGYIATNNHVIEAADKIEVMVNGRNRSYKAKVVGRDPSSDLALLKVEAGQLPAMRFANSDGLQIGEWVLAVGNPYNLTSTVTAGIVSAKGRNISASQSRFSIESFIQTDAAINPGNSGGALVNAAGELVGVNTAIVSRTGAYAGYGFAIPSNMAQKILQDLKQFGLVQRAFLEAEVSEISAGLAERLDNDALQGVQLAYVYENGAAAKAGLRADDIITAIDGIPVANQPAYEERLALHRPGEELSVTYLRDGKERQTKVMLVNKNGTTSEVKVQASTSELLGADFEPISKVEKSRYGVEGGIRVRNIRSGIIKRMGLPEDYIIVALNGRTYTDAQALIGDLERSSGRIILQGINPDGTRGTRSFYWY